MGLIFGTMRHFWNYRIIFFTPWVASFMGTVNFGTMGPIIAFKKIIRWDLIFGTMGLIFYAMMFIYYLCTMGLIFGTLGLVRTVSHI